MYYRSLDEKIFFFKNFNATVYMMGRKLIVAVSHQVVSSFLVAPWATVFQAPLSMGFPRQKYWSGFPEENSTGS